VSFVITLSSQTLAKLGPPASCRRWRARSHAAFSLRYRAAIIHETL